MRQLTRPTSSQEREGWESCVAIGAAHGVAGCAALVEKHVQTTQPRHPVPARPSVVDGAVRADLELDAAVVVGLVLLPAGA
jgi:hypothetical protein